MVAGPAGTRAQMTGAQEHWEAIYRTKSHREVSWYTPHLEASLALLRETPLDAAVIDVGGGASTLVDDLLQAGYEDLTVLDVSETALRIAQDRLGERANRVAWIRGDITSLATLPKVFDVWHDRAVFHFLTRDTERRAYVRLLRQDLKPGGRAMFETFAPQGPPQCSGLSVVRYDAEELGRELGIPFKLRSSRTLVHTTPDGREQPFVLCEFVYGSQGITP
jgi:SAM-dependent methyltransferase